MGPGGPRSGSGERYRRASGGGGGEHQERAEPDRLRGRPPATSGSRGPESGARQSPGQARWCSSLKLFPAATAVRLLQRIRVCSRAVPRRAY